MDDRETAFWVSRRDVAFALLPGIVGLVSAGLLYYFMSSIRESPFVLVILLLTAPVYELWFRRVVYVSRAGIRGPGKGVIPWSEVADVDSRHIRFPLGYLSVQAEDLPTVRISRSIVRNPDFYSVLLKLSPPENRLAKTLPDIASG